VSESRTDGLIAEFCGTVRCTPEAGASPGLTLRGASADDRAEHLILSFIGASGAELPATLDAPRVVAAGAHCYRIESGPRRWSLQARTLHLHRDVGAAFLQAVPPRRAPLGKRLFWQSVLWLARRRAGLRLLAALRGR
jgi:hypothetical protein